MVNSIVQSLRHYFKSRKSRKSTRRRKPPKSRKITRRRKPRKSRKITRRRKSTSSSRKKSGGSRKQNCIKRSNLELNLHQANAVKKFMKEDGYAFIHGVGTGKTLSAVAASQCFLDRYPKRKVIFVGPTSLLLNFEKELGRYGVTKGDIKSKYEMISFAAVMHRAKKNNPIDCKGNMLIIDEVHNLRNRKETKKARGNAHKAFSKRYKSMMECAQKAKKRLLLTATPIINNIGDLFALINFIYGRNVAGTRDDVKAKHAEEAIGKTLNQANLDSIYRLLKGRMDYFTDTVSSKFPLTKQHYVSVVMPRAYKKQYEKYII